MVSRKLQLVYLLVMENVSNLKHGNENVSAISVQPCTHSELYVYIVCHKKTIIQSFLLIFITSNKNLLYLDVKSVVDSQLDYENRGPLSTFGGSVIVIYRCVL